MFCNSNQLHSVHLHHAISLPVSPAACPIYTLLFCLFLAETLILTGHSSAVYAKSIYQAFAAKLVHARICHLQPAVSSRFVLFKNLVTHHARLLPACLHSGVHSKTAS
ncbi:hypothetical protein ILYODFUR_022645 [Ilyodon furcidens]|uniref:Secreted protein n=1 Tax=Ilyodon furcidens TaxID=33524 RepID=A0ABV0TWV4_9TELE